MFIRFNNYRNSFNSLFANPSTKCNISSKIIVKKLMIHLLEPKVFDFALHVPLYIILDPAVKFRSDIPADDNRMTSCFPDHQISAFEELIYESFHACLKHHVANHSIIYSYYESAPFEGHNGSSPSITISYKNSSKEVRHVEFNYSFRTCTISLCPMGGF